MEPPHQLEFEPFKSRPRWKPFRGRNKFDLWYCRLPKGRIRVQLSDGELIDITKESPGRSGRARLYTKVPGHEGIVQGRNLQSFLAQLCLIDQIRQLNRSAQIKLKQSDDAARMLSDITKDDAAAEQKEKANLLAEIERLKAELEAAKTASAQAPKDDAREPRKAGQSVNIRALQWALEQGGLSAPAKEVLMILAIHSDDRGYSWPSLDRIAFISGLDSKTVRRQIDELLVRGKIRRTIERRGKTKQVKVFRLPKITWERRALCPPLKNDEREAKTGHKAGERRALCPPNKEQRIKNNPSEKNAFGTSVPSCEDKALERRRPISSFSSSLSSPKEETQEPAWFEEIRAKYPGTTVEGDLKRIEKWARKKGKEFTRDLALNALRRNPPKKPGQREGYSYHGKFIPKEKAIALAVQNEDFLLNAKREIR
jgi:hypothetical protein